MPEFDVAGGQKPEEERTLLNRFFDTLKWMSPVVNLGRLGQVEPPAAFLRDGMIAYADGTNWNPGWGEGYYRYSVSDVVWEPIQPSDGHKSYTLRSRPGASGYFYTAGFYDAPTSDTNRTQAQTTQTLGDANVSYAAHTFIVFGAASGSGGSGADRKIKLTVTGTRIQDDGTRTGSYTETVTDDAEALTLDDFLEQEKFLGQVTFTLSATGVDPYTSFSMDFNYGFAKYDDFGNNTFHVEAIECTGKANANDSGFDIELLHHESIGWTYHASAFVPGTTPLAKLSTIHGAEREIVSGEDFAFKVTDLHETIDGGASEGIIIRMTTTTNNSVEYMNAHVGYH